MQIRRFRRPEAEVRNRDGGTPADEIHGRLAAAVEPDGSAPAAALPSAVAAAGIPHDLVRALRALPRDPRHRSKIDYGALAAALAE